MLSCLYWIVWVLGYKKQKLLRSICSTMASVLYLVDLE